MNAFWSITAYTADKFLSDNPINRYVINSPMLPALVKDTVGSFTLYLQNELPGADLERTGCRFPEMRSTWHSALTNRGRRS